MSRGIWVGHRGSDSSIIHSLCSATTSASCFGQMIPAGDGGQASAVSVERTIGRRLIWSSNEQEQASGLLMEDVSKGLHNRFDFIIPYRADLTLERISARTNVPVYAIPYSLFRRIAAKRFMLDLAKEGGAVSPGVAVDRGVIRYSNVRSVLGKPFFLKTDNTVSGIGSFLIESELDFNRVMEHHGSQISTGWKFVEGVSLNYHFCVGGNNSIILFPPSVQIIKKQGPYCRFEFYGNDFQACRLIDPLVLLHAASAVLDVAQRLALRGFRGVGGADVISDSHGASVVDINPRFQGSSALLSFSLFYESNQSLGAFHRSSFLPDSAQLFSEQRTVVLDNNWLGAQVFVKNGGSSVSVEQFAADGIYDISDVPTYLRGLHADGDFANNEVAVIDLPEKDTEVAPGATLARVWLPVGSPLYRIPTLVEGITRVIWRLLRLPDETS